MVSQREREKLTEAFKREPLTGAAVILKCIAGLIVVAGLAIIGAQTDTADATATAANQPGAQRHVKASIAHSKTLYQERQARLEPAQARLAIEVPPADAADTGNPNQKSSLTPRVAAPVIPLHN